MGWIMRIVFLVLKKENKFVWFYTIDCAFLSLTAIATLFAWILSCEASNADRIVTVIPWFIIMLKAYPGS